MVNIDVCIWGSVEFVSIYVNLNFTPCRFPFTLGNIFPMFLLTESRHPGVSFLYTSFYGTVIVYAYTSGRRKAYLIYGCFHVTPVRPSRGGHVLPVRP